MAKLLTFLGKGGVGRTSVAIALAHHWANCGQRVLLVSQGAAPGFSAQLGAPVGTEPQPVAAGLEAVQLSMPHLLEKGWDQLKQLESQYLRTPFFKNVYGQELAILPGLDSALTLNAVREYDHRYDRILLDGSGDLVLLRMLGLPEVLGWYVRRFSQVFQDSELGRTLSPFIAPVTAAVFASGMGSVSFGEDSLAFKQAKTLLESRIDAIANPRKAQAHLITTADPGAIATAQYLWGAAQQVGLGVSRVWVNCSASPLEAQIQSSFAPLPVNSLPRLEGALSSQALVAALAQQWPGASWDDQLPTPVAIDEASRTVRLFLPGLDKKQIKLTQYGPELTIEAGDQRRNLLLPLSLRGQPVKAARFQEGYLVISL
jgi:hypothetical protein